MQSLQSFYNGTCLDAYQIFGAHLEKTGCLFRVYAPNARSVSLIGSFNDWNPQAAPLNRRQDNMDLWEIFLPGVKEWDSYKYHIVTADGRTVDKADPYAFYSETRPQNASKVVDLNRIVWHDAAWLQKRTACYDRPVSIYEVYAGGWKKNGPYEFSYDMMREQMIPYVREMGFTHIEFMPLTEYPFDGSWGYQASGYFSLTSRYGNPVEFAAFVDECHRQGIGVIMDMVPVHFVKDDFGLRLFDGTPLYEYPLPQDAESEWGTLNFDLGKDTVRSFLISAAAFWLRTYHIDGIRFDAVANLIYYGGNRDRGTNQGGLEFIRRLNSLIKNRDESVMLIAEDSTDYPHVTGAVQDGGLGFDYKWDLGWMNDTLDYFATDPLWRIYHHNELTFSMAYFYSERFLMPLSHDENVHSKKTIVDRMWGSYDQKFLQVRALYAYMFAHPGKKLNFMGNEIASFREFDEKKELDWFLLKYPRHDAFRVFFRDLNHLYQQHSCLYQYDYEGQGFRWIDPDNGVQSIYSFWRENEKECIVCILNLSSQSYDSFACFVPYRGTYREILNTDDDRYDGGGFCNRSPLRTSAAPKNPRQWQWCLHLQLPAFSAVWLWMARRKKRNT